MFKRHSNEELPAFAHAKFTGLHNVPIDDMSDVVLDGEVAVVNPETGRIKFESVMQQFKSRMKPGPKRPSRSRFITSSSTILGIKGRGMRAVPLTARKELLKEVNGNNPFFNRVSAGEGMGTTLFEVTKGKKLGIVANGQSCFNVEMRTASRS